MKKDEVIRTNLEWFPVTMKLPDLRKYIIVNIGASEDEGGNEARVEFAFYEGYMSDGATHWAYFPSPLPLNR